MQIQQYENAHIKYTNASLIFIHIGEFSLSLICNMKYILYISEESICETYKCIFEPGNLWNYSHSQTIFMAWATYEQKIWTENKSKNQFDQIFPMQISLYGSDLIQTESASWIDNRSCHHSHIW